MKNSPIDLFGSAADFDLGLDPNRTKSPDETFHTELTNIHKASGDEMAESKQSNWPTVCSKPGPTGSWESRLLQ